MPNDQGAAAQGSDSETVRVLRAARARIGRGWCKGREARDHLGRATKPLAADAVQWCMYGALAAEGCDEHHPAVDWVSRAVGMTNFGDWQDAQPTVGPVLRKFDQAIALALASGEPAAGPSEAPPKESK